MCPTCRTENGGIIGLGLDLQSVGTHKKTAKMLTRCLKCDDYFLLDSFSPTRRVVTKEWVDRHIQEFVLREEPDSIKLLRKEYPIQDKLPGWFFRVKEISAGCCLAEGQHFRGRSVSRMGFDKEKLLDQIVCDARDWTPG